MLGCGVDRVKPDRKMDKNNVSRERRSGSMWSKGKKDLDI